MPVFGTNKKPSISKVSKYEKGTSPDFISKTRPGTTSQGNGGPMHIPKTIRKPAKF